MPTSEALRLELLQMAERDQAVRSEAFGGGRTNARAASTQAEAVDRRNTMRMREIVARAGWPDKDVVGEDGAQAAWLLVQHADDLTFQRHCLALLERAADSGLVDPAHVAYLTDRVRMKEGRPQIYGTQLRERDGRLVPFPIEDAERVDHRRARVGMPPLAEYLTDMRESAARLSPRQIPSGASVLERRSIQEARNP